ncbi:MAG TPA: DUF4132 domain-containing protein, partial [Gemmataceae bacterium]|nr:DUF4132 domain-containing protein [Gemmataceae bacterium]
MQVNNNDDARRLVDKLLAEVQKTGHGLAIDLADFPSGRSILELHPPQQISVVFEALARQTESMNQVGRQEWNWRHFGALKELINVLLRKKLPFRLEDITRIIELTSQGEGFYSWQLSLGRILYAVSTFVEDHGLPESLRSRLLALKQKLGSQTGYAETRKAITRLDGLLDQTSQDNQTLLLKTDEAWTRFVREQLGKLGPPAQKAWTALLLHCATATQSKPSKKWLQEASALIAAIDSEKFTSMAVGILGEIGKPGAPHNKIMSGYEFPLDPTVIHDTHSDLLRGLVWCLSLVNDDRLIKALGDAADISFKKIPGFGPRAPKIGNACLYSLSAAGTLAGAGQLSRIKTRVKHPSIRKQLGKALNVAAQKTGLSAEELEEVAAPTCGLTAVGECQTQVGDFTACLKIGDRFKTELSWQKADGKPQKSVPAEVKQDFSNELKLLKQSQKEIEKLVPAQRARLEQLFLQERSWSLADFRIRYLDHPLVGPLARRLIWRFTDGKHAGESIWSEGRIVDIKDKPLKWLCDQSRVRLWHPITSGVEQVQAWRHWFEVHEICQPFKQAHREVYVLTAAERQTDTYSNRFAAHILRQHQFTALCQQRGWRYTLQGNWDSHNIPTLQLPQSDMRVEFWVEGLQDSAEGGTSGVFLHLATDQVRFYRGGEAEPLSLESIPPLVFSEIMRDVDLFVGVASVGNDPNWS